MKKVINAIGKGLKWFFVNLCEALAVISLLAALPFLLLGEVFDYIYDKLTNNNHTSWLV